MVDSDNPNIAIQDQIPHNHCYGCGNENPKGLHIKSFWMDENVAYCDFRPQPHHCAGPTHFVNGGIISTIIDCHCVCMAISKGYQLQGRETGEGEHIWFATGNLNVSFLKPVPIDTAVTLRAEVIEASEKKMKIVCELFSNEAICCRAEVIAVKVPNEWFHSR